MNATPCNVADLLHARVVAGFGGDPAVRAGGRVFSYGEVAGLAARVANLLRRLEVGRGERVGLLMFDGIEFLAAFHGAASMGAVPALINPSLPTAEIEALLGFAGARVVVASGGLVFHLRSIRTSCPPLKEVVVVGDGVLDGALRWSEAVGAESAESEVLRMNPTEPAFWLFSSGSTGRPKAVVHSHGSPAVTGQLYGQGVLGLRRDDVCFSAARLFHAYGLGNSLTFPESVGASVVLHPGPPLPEVLFDVLRRERPTVFFATPALYVAMLHHPAGADRSALESVRLCVSAAEALPGSTLERWRERFGLGIVDGIGSTEMLHIFISNRPGIEMPGSSGIPVPGYECRVVDERGVDVPDGEAGALWVRGPSRFVEYFGEPERTAAVVRDDWVATGDTYVRDGEGRYWFRGRADDMLKVNGLWVSPVEIEECLAGHPDVGECAVVGVKDPDGLTQVKAFIVRRGDGVAGKEEPWIRALQGWVRQRLPQKYPRLFEVVPSLPRTASGKIKRFELRQAAGAGGMRP